MKTKTILRKQIKPFYFVERDLVCLKNEIGYDPLIDIDKHLTLIREAETEVEKQAYSEKFQHLLWVNYN